MPEEIKSLSIAPSDPRLVLLARCFSEVASILSILVGALVLVGWKFSLVALKSISPAFVAMQPNTAVGLILIGISLWLLQEKRANSPARYLGWSCAAAAILLGALSLSEYLFGLDLGIGQLLFRQTPGAIFIIRPGLMALNTAFAFIFIGSALLLLQVKSRRLGVCPSQILAIMVGIISLVALVGYINDLSIFYFGIGRYTAMSVHAAMILLIVHLGVLSARPEQGLTSLLVTRSESGALARRLLPPAFLSPLVFSFLIEWSGHHGWFSESFGLAAATAAMVIVFSALVVLNAFFMERREAERDRLLDNLEMEISRAKQAEEALAKSLAESEKLSLIVKHTTEAIAIMDVDDISLLRYVNPAWEKLSGYKNAEVVGKLEPPLIEAARRDPIIYARFWESVKSGTPFFAELEWRKKDGTFLPVEIFSVPFHDTKTGKLGWINSVRDISERKKADKKIEAEKLLSVALTKDLEKFKLAVDGALDMIIIDDVDGKVLYANQAVETVTGYTPKEAVGKKSGVLWGKHMSEEFYAKMWDTIKNQKKPWAGEIINRRKNGENFVSESHISPLLDISGNVQFFVGIERDITKAKEVDKMKTEFVSIASHQLRTPLTAIKWYTELALRSKLDAKNKKYLRQVAVSNDRMIRLVGDLLDASRIDTGTKFGIVKAEVDIVPIIKEAIDAQSISAQHAKVAVKIMSGFPKKLVLSLDSAKISQVFQNLIDNAIKYSPNDGRVAVGYRQTDNDAVFYVEDNGVGIPKKEQSRLFQRFFRASNVLTLQVGGTGLGLYLVKAIVEGHGGKIWFESEEGKGTTFYVSLPLIKN